MSCILAFLEYLIGSNFECHMSLNDWDMCHDDLTSFGTYLKRENEQRSQNNLRITKIGFTAKVGRETLLFCQGVVGHLNFVSPPI